KGAGSAGRGAAGFGAVGRICWLKSLCCPFTRRAVPSGRRPGTLGRREAAPATPSFHHSRSSSWSARKIPQKCHEVQPGSKAQPTYNGDSPAQLRAEETAVRAETLFELSLRRPFVPVRLHVADGHSYDVRRPEEMLVTSW